MMFNSKFCSVLCLSAFVFFLSAAATAENSDGPVKTLADKLMGKFGSNISQTSGGEASDSKENSAPAPGSSTESAEKINAVEDNRPRKNNPFLFNIPGGRNAFLPADSITIPAGIEVRAIMIVENSRSIAALKMPDSDELLYVTVGDIVGVQHKKTASKKVSARSSGNSGDTEIVYIQIENITSQQVELYPKSNPGGKEILR